MKVKTVVSLAAFAAAAALAVPAAMADVARYQESSLTYNVVSGLTSSTLAIVVNPCDGSFSGSLSDATSSTAVSGNISGSAISLNSMLGTYDPVTGSFTLATSTNTISATLLSSSESNFKNHGAFVKSVPPSERSQAAHSCIGMPLQSYKAGYGHQQSFANLHGKSASAPGHNKSSSSSTSTSTSTSTAPTGPGNGHANADADTHANANASDNGNGGGNGNGNGHGKP